MEFSLFFDRMFHHLFAKFVVFLNAPNLKNSDFTYVNAYFYEILFFVFDVQLYRKLVKMQWRGRGKGSQKSMKFG